VTFVTSGEVTPSSASASDWIFRAFYALVAAEISIVVRPSALVAELAGHF